MEIPANVERHRPADQPAFGPRTIPQYDLSDMDGALRRARTLFQQGDVAAAFDLYEQLATACPEQAVPILAEVYDQTRRLGQPDRYLLYQSRYFHFGIRPGDKVLDVGSGNVPFHAATHLADLAVDDDEYGRAGVPFKHVEGKPVYRCDIEQLPFGDKEFDFVYCSHVLEHVHHPERACRELMRVARRGYIETPSPAKDLWLDTAAISHHRWAVEVVDGKLVFTEYAPERIRGLQCDIVRRMHCDPQSDREKALSAMVYLKARILNTMLLWDGDFEFEVRRRGSDRSRTLGVGAGMIPAPVTPSEKPRSAGRQSSAAPAAAPGRHAYERIYHYHIRKTGGTSLNYMFLSLGGEPPEEVYRRLNADTTRPVVSGGKAFCRHETLIEQGQYFYAFSHTPAHRLRLPAGTFTLTCLRDPVERVLSYYRMLLYYQVNNIPHPCMKTESVYLGESFSDFLTRVPPSVLLNQLYMFSEQLDVEEAFGRITHCSHWMLLEDFDAGVRRLSEKLGIDLQPMHVRKSQCEVAVDERDRQRLTHLLEPEFRLLDRLRRLDTNPSVEPMDRARRGEIELPQQTPPPRAASSSAWEPDACEISGISLRGAVRAHPELEVWIERINQAVRQGRHEQAAIWVREHLGHLAKSDLILSRIRPAQRLVRRRPVTPWPVRVERLQLERIGSEYGGWMIDPRLVPQGATILSAGVGEDITFDMGLIAARDCTIIGIDPTPKAVRYVQAHAHPRFHLIAKALAAQGGLRVRMYENANPDHVSESMLASHQAVNTGRFYEADTVSLTELLAAYPDAAVLKMDIEGAEYAVLDAARDLKVPQICVEFHHVCTDHTLEDTLRCVAHLRRMGYLVAHRIDKAGPWHEVTFVHCRCLNRPAVRHRRREPAVVGG